MNDAIGLLGFFRPTLALLMAFEMATTASSWPMTLLWRVSSIFKSLSLSSLDTFSTGIPVQLATMLEMSVSVTTGPVSPAASSSAWVSSLFFWVIASIWALSSISLSLSWPAFSKSCPLTAASFSLRRALSSLSSSLASSGSWACLSLTLEPASSIKSMALSGKKRSEMYCEEYWAAASSASSVYLSLWCISYLSLSPDKI
mmetsp:Transcript_31393/g.67758  ORF Transcript_31393/g.67758 Transcript_31393/m.67758 type:complete len:201 (+) Transcript_31393:938-1540(+)